MSAGERTELERVLCKGRKKKFETKMTMVGEDDDLAREARVLSRIVRWHPRKGSPCEADPGHAETISRVTGAEKLEAVSTPAAKETEREAEEWVNFLAQDRADIARLPQRNATRIMTSPKDDWNKLVTIGRYLVRYPRAVNWCKYQNETEQVAACTDSDWAGCRRT